MTDIAYLTTPAGQRLAYYDTKTADTKTGDGEPVLALHGAFGRGRPFLPLLSGTGRRVVAVDQRGHGHSDRADDYSRAAYLADTEAVIEALDLAPAVIVGHSLGGINAYQLAARRPELVRALVVIDMSAELAPSVSSWLEGFPERFDSLVELRAELAARITIGSPEHFLEGAFEDERGWGLRWRPDDVVATKAAIYDSWWDDWSASRHPTLLLRGERSLVVSADMAERMLATRPNTTLATVDGAGHDLYVTHREQAAATIEGFLAGL